MLKKLCMSCWKKPASLTKASKHYCTGCYENRKAAIAKVKKGK